MQVNNIINLAYSAPAPAASPSAGLVADVAVPENGLSSFGDIIATPAAPVSEIVNDLQINDPQSGIIPIPQIYGAATPILAPVAPQPIAQEYIDLGNDGQISQEVLQAAFSKTAPNVIDLSEAQAQQILAQGNLGETFPLANEVENAADFDAEFEMQLASLQTSVTAPENTELSAKIAALNPAAASVADTDKVQKLIDEHLNKLDELAAATEDKIADDSLNAQLDDAIIDNEILANNTLNLSSVAVANKQVGEDFKEFDTKPIDVNELKMGGKLHGIEHSKLEAQIKHLAQAEAETRSPIEQIKVKISQGIDLGQDKISIKLHPAELGKVDVEMDVDKEGKTHVRIVADRSETLDFLRRDSTELQKALRDVGMATDDSNLQFSLNQNQNGGNKGEQFAQAPQHQAYKAAIEEYSAYVPQSQAEINLAVSQGGLNIVV